MKTMRLWMWIAILSSGLVLTSCFYDDDNPVNPEVPQESSEN